MSLTVSVGKRDFSGPLSVSVSWQVEELSWKAIGGPDTARLVAFGPQVALWELVELLRCPISITDERGEKVWHGYVDNVELGEKMQFSIGLSSMANRVQVSYTYVILPGEMTAQRLYTAWASDADSIATYGTKELRLSLPLASSDQATALRTTTLSKRKYPVPALSFAANDCFYAVVDCKGWWHTLDWLYYAQPAGKEEYLTGGQQDWIGAQAADTAYSQPFSLGVATAFEAEMIRLRVKTIGAPADNLFVQLCTNAGGVPGVVLWGTTMPGTTLGISSPMLTVEFPLPTPVTLQPATTYHLMVGRSGGIDGMNYYMVDTCQVGASYPRGAMLVYNGAAWGAHVPAADLWFQIVGAQETTLQLSSMIAAQAFFTALDLEVASGVTAPLYRSGVYRLRTEVESLLSTGTSTGRRYLATVSPARRVSIYRAPLPAVATDYGISAAGELFDPAGRPVMPWWGTVGVWARLRSVIPASADVVRIANPSRFFIERAIWSKAGLRLYSTRSNKISAADRYR